MRRLLSIVSPIVAVAITAGAVSALASQPEQAPDDPTGIAVTRGTVVVDLDSVSRVLQTTGPGLERIDGSTVPESVRNVLQDNGAVLLLPRTLPDGAR